MSDEAPAEVPAAEAEAEVAPAGEPEPETAQQEAAPAEAEGGDEGPKEDAGAPAQEEGEGEAAGDPPTEEELQFMHAQEEAPKAAEPEPVKAEEPATEEPAAEAEAEAEAEVPAAADAPEATPAPEAKAEAEAPAAAADDGDDLAAQEAAAIKIQAAHRSKATRNKLQQEKQKRQEESVQSHWAESGLPEDRYLTDSYYKREQFKFDEQQVAGSNVAGLSLKQGLGFDSVKRHNAMLIEDDVLIYSTGKFLVLHKYSIGTRLYLPSLDGGGIGAFDVHPSRKYFCVCERLDPALVPTGRTPNVYIYEYPSLRIYKVLPNGTERAYSACKFNQLDKGATLATVGSFPDFLLSVWDWENEKMKLRSKAFSQDIYSVGFSPKFEGQLITSGTGHIRFWKMAGIARVAHDAVKAHVHLKL